MVHDEGILDHLRELDEAAGDWERYRAITLAELRADRDKRNMVLHALLVSIQASIDIANHLIAASSSRRPETYRESFAILCDKGLIPEDLGVRLSDLAGFRNVLIHLYCRLNLDEVYGVLQDGLPVVNRYRDLVRAMLRDRLLPE
ncbi:DUF86 domain-containing protein [Methanoculleus sp. 10]|jgi:uncharacterized protein YutE (UPF0331/DUF86 family)|uniref:type VII toxin-antitoxin system HepT family RNase toxin n=1 Tax=Methanoculleus sp. 10 TaxID=430615 RepID=UPI001B5EF205|nr:DUF86 domain-containing protein [Methanoculleus sp. 10]MBP7411315.1 DUF86 domain-containing protein [Methanoculleus sp.]